MSFLFAAAKVSFANCFPSYLFHYPLRGEDCVLPENRLFSDFTFKITSNCAIG